MRCPNCGQDVAAGERFCTHCGVPAPTDVSAPDSGSRWLWVAALVVLLIVAGALAYRIYSLQRPVEKASVELTLPPPTPTPALAPSPSESPQVRKPARPVQREERKLPPPPSPTPLPAPASPGEPPAVDTPPPKPSRPRPRVEIFRPEPSEPVAARTPAYQGPSAGTLIWSGQIEKNTLVTINGDQVSMGRLTGELPGVPVSIEPPDSFVIVDAPSAENHYKRLSLRSVKRIRSAVVIKWIVR